MKAQDDDKRNGSGYLDPTAYIAMKSVGREEERFHKYLDALFLISELSGFHIDNRIEVTDLITGRVWK